MGFFGDLWNGVKDFVRDPIGKLKVVGNAVIDGIGKVKGVTGFLKRGADFVRNIPVIGDIVRNAPILSNIGNAIDTADKYAGQADNLGRFVRGK